MPKSKPFDIYYEKYETWFQNHHYAYLSELKALRHLTPAHEKGLEIGIGSGRFAAPLGIRFGIEPSAPMRYLARRKGLQVLNGKAESLPFQNSVFQVVLMVTTICFVDDLRRSLAEAHRVLADGGVIILGFVDNSSPLGKEYENHKTENVFYREAVFYSANSVISLLGQSSFSLQTVLQTVFGRLSSIENVQDFRLGHGNGGFVAVQAKKGKSYQ